MNSIRRICVAAATIITGACSGDDARTAELDVVVSDSAGVRIVELSDPADARLASWRVEREHLLSIGTATGAPEDELFGAVAAARLADRGVVIANSGTREVRVYDASGAHVRTMGREGQGPGEFSAIGWVGAAGDTLLAYDPFLQRMTWFTPGGDVARTVPYSPAGPGGSPIVLGRADGRMIMQSGFDRQFGRGERRDTVSLFVYDAEGAVSDSFGAYPGPERFFFVAPDGSMASQHAPIHGRDVHADVFADRIAIGSSDAFAIDVFDSGMLTMKVRAPVPLRMAERADIDAEREARAREAPEQWRQAHVAAVEATPARETIPAFSDIIVDSEKWIWVREAPRHRDDAPEWVVLDSDGVPRARVDMPAGLDVYEIGSDYVLGRLRDSNGVERIVAHTLVRG